MNDHRLHRHQPAHKLYEGHILSDNDEKLLKIVKENLTLEESQLSDEDKLKIEHLRLHEKHRGHEGMHAEMMLILLSVTIVAQAILIIWKKSHFKSYQFVSMIGVWLIPFCLCLNNHWWRFIFIWLIFSCITSLVMVKAIQRPLHPTTPRQVYKWFFLLYKLCCVLGVSGYILVMITLLGINFLFGVRPTTWIDAGLLLMFYGLYYGVLSRDLAEVCADKMASHIGYYKSEGMPTRTLEPGICAICGNPQLVPVGEEGVIEDTYKLSCGHTFHEFCIRGWCIIGKKQICPYCKEKVDMKKICSNPWERPQVFYGQFLDWIRLLVAWQPLTILLVQNINTSLGLQ